MHSVFLFASFALAARAELTFCNQTKAEISAAVGYFEAGEWVSAGWFRLKPGECEAVLTGTLNNRYYYTYAVNAGDTRVWGGNYQMCTGPKPFTVKGTGRCAERGLREIGFHQIDIGDSASFTLNFSPPASD